MKTNLSIINIIVAVSVIILTGCKKPIEEEVNPMCEYWAPEDCTFSLDKYNSPAELCDYFMEHDSTIQAHVGDTLKIWGWVYYHGSGEPIPIPYETDPLREAWSSEAKKIYLVGNEDHHGWYEAIQLVWTDSFLHNNPDFMQSFDTYLAKKWYVSATLSYWEMLIPCSMYSPIFNIVSIDTIPKDK